MSARSMSRQSIGPLEYVRRPSRVTGIEPFSESDVAAVRPDPNRARGRADDIGDVVEGELLEPVELDDLALVARKGGQRGANLPGHIAVAGAGDRLHGDGCRKGLLLHRRF